MRAVAYLRVSSTSQIDGYSLDAQERLFMESCRNHGWESVRVYREEGRSAHSDSVNKRPEMRQLLRDAVRGDFDLVVVHTLDRWARNVEVLIRTIKQLKEQGVQLQSITESLDDSNPQGRLLLQVLGSFAEFSSDMLAEHVKKGLKERAIQGKRVGGIPFGYHSCWTKEHGEKKLICDPEHPGGIHLVMKEAQAIREIFRRYAAGNVSCGELASWLNGLGFRTRNTKKLPDDRGVLSQAARLFTAHGVADLLKNRFFAGLVSYKAEYFQGQHDALVSQEVFDMAQDALRKNNGRSSTISSRPTRQYLLKGIIRCAHCMMPMWAQTYTSGHGYYREHRNSRSHGPCPAVSGSIPCDVADQQVSKLVTAIELGPRWMEEVMAIVAVKDQVEDVQQQRKLVIEKLHRLAQTYVDGHYPEDQYRQGKRRLELELESLVVPEVSAAEEAGRLLSDLPALWQEANLEERRELLVGMLDAVYVETKEFKQVVAIQPKPAFAPVFQVVTAREGSGVVLIKGSPQTSFESGETDLCSWWRRGRVERYLKHELAVLVTMAWAGKAHTIKSF